jgi:hypothetical protein
MNFDKDGYAARRRFYARRGLPTQQWLKSAVFKILQD